MNASDYIVDYLIQMGVTDAFGIPGGVILDFLYALDRRTPEITPHLTYHEQGAVFAACGYAQASGRLGVAYATRGPGVTNMITGIADAYYDSIPLLVITAHASTGEKSGMRIEIDQEMDPLPMVSGITKYASRIDRAEDVFLELENACSLALCGRPGPVLLDIHTDIFLSDIVANDREYSERAEENRNWSAIEAIHEALSESKRPVLLIGDGIRQSKSVEFFKTLAEKMRIPVLSSRAGQDIIPDSPYYFGYIGSHGMRCSNFVLSKADLIISIGNRLSFPINSKSFRPVLEKAKTIRIDVDENELKREIPNSQAFISDLKCVLPDLAAESWKYPGAKEWLSVCKELREKLCDCDINEPIDAIVKILKNVDRSAVIVSDIGNHEFWLSCAYAHAGVTNRILYSKSFGSLGCAIGKAIGAYYATGKPVVCFAGDQGFQMNIQELQYIVSNKLPICVVVVNNHSSGMIRSRQKQRKYARFLHTTEDSGYSVPDFRKIAYAYGIYYFSNPLELDIMNLGIKPCLVELTIDQRFEINTNLSRANKCQNLDPEIEEDLYNYLNLL